MASSALARWQFRFITVVALLFAAALGFGTASALGNAEEPALVMVLGAATLPFIAAAVWAIRGERQISISISSAEAAMSSGAQVFEPQPDSLSYLSRVSAFFAGTAGLMIVAGTLVVVLKVPSGWGFIFLGIVAGIVAAVLWGVRSSTANLRVALCKTGLIVFEPGSRALEMPFSLIRSAKIKEKPPVAAWFLGPAIRFVLREVMARRPSRDPIDEMEVKAAGCNFEFQWRVWPSRDLATIADALAAHGIAVKGWIGPGTEGATES